MSTASIFFHLQSFCILCLLWVGFALRRRRRLHVPLMVGAMLWDIVLIVQIELFRDALFQASRFMQNPWLLNTHIALAGTVLLFYGASVYTGRRLLANDFSIRRRHRLFGLSALVLRVLTFLTGLLYSLGKGVSLP